MEFKLPKNLNFRQVDLKSVLQIRKFIYLPATVVVVVVLLSTFIVFPRVNRILQLRKELEKSREQLVTLEEKLQTLENLDESSLLDQLQSLEKILPSHKA